MKENNENDDLKLIYVHKVGYNSKNDGLFQFIFSKDPTNIDIENWLWDVVPASDNACVPTEGYYDEIYDVKIKDFDLFCLHEAVDREYMHGYHNIHALAYEIEKVSDGYDSYDKLINDSNSDEDEPLLVFHYGMSYNTVKDLFYSRNIKLVKG